MDLKWINKKNCVLFPSIQLYIFLSFKMFKMRFFSSAVGLYMAVVLGMVWPRLEAVLT